MNFHTYCLHCQSTSLVKLPKFDFAYLCKCQDCGFVFSQRIPTLQDLQEHYSTYGRNDYLSPVTITRYNELLDTLEPYRKTNKLIDVGCGIGYFLEEAKKRGWEVYGTEYTDEAVAICRAKGITMDKGALNPENYTDGEFDIVTSFEVIEHINNPIEEIKHFHKLLRQGGATYITTPNFNALERYLLQEKYNVISYPEHLSYYTKTTLNALMTKLGFTPKKVQTTGISLSRLKNQINHAAEKQIEKDNTDDKIRNLTEEKGWAIFAKHTINSLLDFTATGNALKALYIKK
jgi:2-polyprenyl-3-methyl-5-hydroxy-6-metoxy-1,4-benzoquinol methylase